MDSASTIRNKVIDQLLAVNDTDFLLALSRMIDQSKTVASTVYLTEEQKIMLGMSDEDITAGRVIDQQVLHERELLWLKGK